MSVPSQFKRLVQILKGTPFEGALHSPASEGQLAQLEGALGFPIAGGLREMWLLANGAEYRRYGTPVFGVWTDRTSPCGFLAVEEVLVFGGQLPRDEDFAGYEEEDPRDPRIEAGWFNSRWVPFAQFNGQGTIVFYDAAPGPAGRTGQIIAYQHDPDAMYFVAESFEEFFVKSNRLLKNDSALIEWIRENDAA